jgi:hypothetical protein
MSFTVIVYSPRRAVSTEEVDTIEAAREIARVAVNDRMEAFSDDREALERYGFIDAEDRALALSEEGGVIFLQDGWKVEVINNDHE